MTILWTRVAGLSGAAAVALGAVGAHTTAKKPEAFREVWKTASLYHFVHTLALLGVASSAGMAPRKKAVVNSCFVVGILLFSGSCYVIAHCEERKPYSSVTPLGGVSFIAGWVLLAAL